MQTDIVIQSHELKRWLKNYPSAKDYLAEGYKATISDISKNVFSDNRAKTAHHAINTNFVSEPKYFCSFRQDETQPLVAIHCIYVFPKYRNLGYGKHIVSQMKNYVRDQGILQVAVETEKVELLSEFYLSLGFKTTGVSHINEIGKGYVDYFWSYKPYKLHDEDNQTLLQPDFY